MSNYQIYTSKRALVVETKMPSGVQKDVRNLDGTYTQFYKSKNSTKFSKTGWGAKAKDCFMSSLIKAKKELV